MLLGTTVANLLPNVAEEIVSCKLEVENEEGDTEGDTNELDSDLDDAYLNQRNSSIFTTSLLKESKDEDQIGYLIHLQIISPPPRA